MSRVCVSLLILVCAGCTQFVPQTMPPLTCFSLDVVQETGPGVSNIEGLDLDALAASAPQWQILAESDGWSSTVELGLVQVVEGADHELVERRLPPNRDVFAGVDAASCLTGTLVRGPVQLEATLEHPEHGTLRLNLFGHLEGDDLDPTRAAFTSFTQLIPWSDLDREWRNLLRPLRGSQLRKHQVRFFTGGSFDEGGLEARVYSMDAYGRAELEDVLVIDWAPPN